MFNALAPTSQTTQNAGKAEKSITQRVRDASGFVEMCEIWGYRAEEHIVRTEDGYLLGVHRVMKQGTKRGDMKGRKVVYLHHGLLMNSEVWVCLTDKDSCLPFQLAEEGYDVWVSLLSSILIQANSNLEDSWGTTVATNTRRSISSIPPIAPNSGISQSTNSLCTTFPTRLVTS